MQKSSRPLTPQERPWVTEILSGHLEWFKVDLNEIHVRAESSTGNMHTMKLSKGTFQVECLRGTKGYLGRIEMRTADNFGITVTLDHYDGSLKEFHVDFLDLEEPGDRPQHQEWLELAHVYTKM